MTMFENELQSRCTICGTRVTPVFVFVAARFPFILLTVPIAVLFHGLVADPAKTHVVCYGMLSIAGIFDFAALTDECRGCERE
jgi:hypothetical protein